MMTFDEFIRAYLGKTVGYPTNSQYYGECLSLVKWYIKECFNINPPASGCNGARCYYSLFPSPLGTVFKKVANTPDLIPEKGWIAVWNEKSGGGSGHIAIVFDDRATKSYFYSMDQNWSGKQTQVEKHSYQNVSGFLVPLSISQGNMSEKKYTEEEMSKVRLERDSNWNLYQEQLSENKVLKEKLQKEIDDEKNNHQSDLVKIAVELGVSPDIEKIVPAIKTCIKFEDKANELDKILQENKAEYQKNLDEVAKVVDSMNKQIVSLQRQLKEANIEIERLKKEKPQIEPVQGQSFIQKLLDIIFNR